VCYSFCSNERGYQLVNMISLNLVCSWILLVTAYSQAMRNFVRLDFCNEIFGKTDRIRFSDIHNPGLRFLHRWFSFMLFLMREFRFVTVAELRCFFCYGA
jgi:hypothetical protein